MKWNLYLLINLIHTFICFSTIMDGYFNGIKILLYFYLWLVFSLDTFLEIKKNEIWLHWLNSIRIILNTNLFEIRNFWADLKSSTSFGRKKKFEKSSANKFPNILYSKLLSMKIYYVINNYHWNIEKIHF